MSELEVPIGLLTATEDAEVTGEDLETALAGEFVRRVKDVHVRRGNTVVVQTEEQTGTPPPPPPPPEEK